MAITNFIPTIWSENLLKNLDSKYVAVSHCNRDYEGDIKMVGSKVKICGVGDITVGDYTKNTDMSNPETLSDTVAELTVDQAKYFNFQIDDIDRAQATPKLMDAAMKVAANALANEADMYVLGLTSYDSHDFGSIDNTADAIVNTIIKARQTLFENNVLDTDDIVVEITPEIATTILKAKMEMSTDNQASLENGYIGSIAGCKIYVSNNTPITPLSENDMLHTCRIRTKRSIAFAEQLSEIEAYRPEKRFADAVKGLHLYGASIIYPAEIVNVAVTVTVA